MVLRCLMSCTRLSLLFFAASLSDLFFCTCIDEYFYIRNYLIPYLLMTMSDWLQGPYVYAYVLCLHLLFASFVFSRQKSCCAKRLSPLPRVCLRSPAPLSLTSPTTSTVFTNSMASILVLLVSCLS